MIDFSDVPSLCPHCDEKLLLTHDPNYTAEGTVYEHTLICETPNCNYSYSVGSTTEDEELQNSEEFDEDEEDGFDDSDNDIEDNENEEADFDDISLMYPNDTEEDAYDDAFDRFVNN